MRNDELQLWKKIKSFQFDNPNVKLTFAKRLAKENAISYQFAEQIVDEYRKFIFLCCVSKEQIAPSHFVDLAWHLHLTYTKSYWVELCKNTIARDLHHNPTEGGEAEDAKFKRLYNDTLKLYQSYFLTPAPTDIWPDENTPARNVAALDKSKWVIPRLRFSFYQQKNSLLFVAIILLTLLLGCSLSDGVIPFLILFVVIIVILILFFKKKNSRVGGDSGSGCGSGYHGGDVDDSGNSSDGGGDSGDSSGSCSGGCGGGGD